MDLTTQDETGTLERQGAKLHRTALSAFGKATRLAIERVGATGDANTEDLFVEISRDIDKQLWLVEAHAQADR